MQVASIDADADTLLTLIDANSAVGLSEIASVATSVDIAETGMSTDEGLKLVVSGGVVKPEGFDGWTRGCRLLER